MAIRVNPQFIEVLDQYGTEEVQLCYQCGDCSTVCPHADNIFKFPRKSMRLLQMGLNQKIETTLEPWLCYYCGDCSDLCPRNANPGGTMMVLRRYLTSVYDWTGLSKMFYKSAWWELSAIFLLGLIVIALLGPLNPYGIVTSLTTEGGVRLNDMFPVKWIDIGDHIMAITVGGLLLSNIFRMWYLSVYKDKSVKIPFTSYFIHAYQLIYQFFTQRRLNTCKDKNYWMFHWFLMTGYTLMFILIVGFLNWFQTDHIYPWYNPQRILGYYATAGLLAGLGFFLWGRIKKSSQIFKLTHSSDWIFIILLLLTAVSGILLHIFRINGMPAATYYTYIIHLAILVPMICIEVPFSKWSHLAYRPFAVYFSEMKKSEILKEMNENLSKN